MNKAFIISGIIMIIFGSIFASQSQGYIGPRESFMFRNPDWLTYGLIIVIIGIAMLGVGLKINQR